jgi:hypothetical protein
VSGDEEAIRDMLAHDPFRGFGKKRVVAFTWRWTRDARLMVAVRVNT